MELKSAGSGIMPRKYLYLALLASIALAVWISDDTSAKQQAGTPAAAGDSRRPSRPTSLSSMKSQYADGSSGQMEMSVQTRRFEEPRSEELTDRLKEESSATFLVGTSESADIVKITYLPDSPLEQIRINHNDEIDDRSILELAETPGATSLRHLKQLIESPTVGSDLKQQALSVIDESFPSASELGSYLGRIIDDINQPDEVRVDALRKLSDLNFDSIRKYSTDENEEISGEVDLLIRIKEHEQQSQ